MSSQTSAWRISSAAKSQNWGMRSENGSPKQQFLEISSGNCSRYKDCHRHFLLPLHHQANCDNLDPRDTNTCMNTRTLLSIKHHITGSQLLLFASVLYTFPFYHCIHLFNHRSFRRVSRSQLVSPYDESDHLRSQDPTDLKLSNLNGANESLSKFIRRWI